MDSIHHKGIIPPATVLVTGGTGFLGSYIIRDLLNTGYQVKALRRSASLPAHIPSAFFERVKWVDSDILDTVGLEEAMEDSQAVIHAAGKVSFHRKDRQEISQTNITGTANVVNACLEKRVGKLVHISSVAALGRSKKQGVINEEAKWENDARNTFYGQSKHRAEMEIWRGIAEGLNAVIVNPSTILGYGNWNESSCALFRNGYNNFPWYAEGINGFVDVEDVAAAVVRLLASDQHSRRFILNGDNWSYQQLLNAIADGFGKKRPGRKVTPLLAEIAWRMAGVKAFFTGSQSLLTRESAKIAQLTNRYENGKILEAFADFRFTPLEKTIQNACRQYLQTC